MFRVCVRVPSETAINFALLFCDQVRLKFRLRAICSAKDPAPAFNGSASILVETEPLNSS